MMYGGIHTYDIKLSNGAWQIHHGRLPSMSRVIVRLCIYYRFLELQSILQSFPSI